MKRLILPILAGALCCACTNEIELSIATPPDHALWRGERAGLLVDVRSASGAEAVTFSVKGLPEGFATVTTVKQVMADELCESYGQCGATPGDGRDSVLVFDRITGENCACFAPEEEGRLWLSINVPSDARPGSYAGKIVASGKGIRAAVPFRFEVSDHTLPAPRDWKFHLDLWQNPYSVARYHDVPLWSDEHFEKMEPVMKRLAGAGQKVVTATILDRPWNGQTEDAFGSMVVKTLDSDGKWSYDYSIFDKWVEFMFSLGIDSQINCYSMIPWHLSFDYTDAASGELRHFEASPESGRYNDYWGSFIRDFAAHLREKGWFEKTCIAMDERPEEAMKAALNVIRTAEPEMKVALAGVSHPAIDDMIYDLCTTFSQPLSDEVIMHRRNAGMVSTFYTCCAERQPNTFLVSDPLEATWLGWYAAGAGYDGYLRWAYNSWTADPVKDARFRRWPAGDCFIVYPDGSSVHFERLMEGIQDYEKIHILKSEWEAEGASGKIEALESALDAFTYPELEAHGAAQAIAAARKVLQ